MSYDTTVDGHTVITAGIGNAGSMFSISYASSSTPVRFTVEAPAGMPIFQILAAPPGNPSPCTCPACVGEVSSNGESSLTRPPGITTVQLIVDFCPGTAWTFSISCAFNPDTLLAAPAQPMFFEHPASP